MKKLIHKQQSQRDRSDLLRWLSSVADPSTNYAAARDKHTQKTGQWILEEKKFRSWMSNGNSFLWLHGKVRGSAAGSGKSFLSTTVIHYLQGHCSASPDQIYNTVAYFYFDFRDPAKQIRTNFLRSIIAQICQGRPDTPESLRQLSKFRDLDQVPPAENLQAALLSAVQDFSNVYIVLDALDECPQSGYERDKVLQCLHEIRGWGVSPLHVLMTSRREHDIASYLYAVADAEDKGTVSSPMSQMSLEFRASEIGSDIEAYIDAQLSGLRFRYWKLELRQKVRTALLEKSQGMFQYVAMQLEVLHSTRISMIEAALDELPDDIDMVYERALQQSPDSSITIRALKWLAYLEGDIDMKTLVFFARLKPVFHYEPSEDNVEVQSLYDHDLDIAAPEDLLRWLPGLVTVYIVEYGYQWVRLCHFSLLEFLISPRTKEVWRIEPTEVRLHIAKSSLAYYLCTIDCDLHPPIITPWKEHPSVCAHNMRRGLITLADIEVQSYPDILTALVRTLFDPCSHYFGRLPGVLPSIGSQGLKYLPKVEKPLQLLYRRGLKPLVPTIIQAIPEVINMVENTEDKLHPTTVLNLAARKHDHEMVRTLLGLGADQFADQDPDSCALRACFYGYHISGGDEEFEKLVNCVKLLLDAGGPEVIQRSLENSSDSTGPLEWLMRLPCAWDSKLVPYLAEILAAHGADLTMTLTRLVSNLNIKKATWLIGHGAEVTERAMQEAQNGLFARGLWCKCRGECPGDGSCRLDAWSRGYFRLLQLLLSRGGVVPPGEEEILVYRRQLRDCSPTYGLQNSPWDAVKRRSFRIVFGTKSRDGTYVKSPEEAMEDLERWNLINRWLLSEKSSPWPPEVPPPGEKDMAFFERWWELGGHKRIDEE
ncbi:hypothetical protein PG991_011998 [Apiospora marii]|uniref:Nephrocystin 3-like N-terminal domain-containing protein n=2 Tax=Apiospora marii TaxID=335849 RepID=A0ABR1RFP9_9PEZI